MNKSAYVLSAEAENDLRNITRYTLQNHGLEQTLKYRRQLETCAENLASGSIPHKVLPDILPEIRYIHCKHHYIFAFQKQENQMVIIAILHERMDIINRLSVRLNK